ncbi:hypothetical protein FVE85_4264 [Porphyridium purpureum]|uniref:Uncharacterized protein n=1 Tax=Porphyridium purpureum TaxID=35688 RepID=A0A5J4YSA9_PORPP|nr:hypothetical protein FVE85_4264 [Porphyridium purpureum]|eukprot:POR0705..scf229_5
MGNYCCLPESERDTAFQGTGRRLGGADDAGAAGALHGASPPPDVKDTELSAAAASAVALPAAVDAAAREKVLQAATERMAKTGPAKIKRKYEYKQSDAQVAGRMPDSRVDVQDWVN